MTQRRPSLVAIDRSGRSQSIVAGGRDRRSAQELGWSEGNNPQIDFRYVVSGDVERMRAAVAELVALGPDVIFVQSNPGVAALQQVNRTAARPATLERWKYLISINSVQWAR